MKLINQGSGWVGIEKVLDSRLWSVTEKVKYNKKSEKPLQFDSSQMDTNDCYHCNLISIFE